MRLTEICLRRVHVANWKYFFGWVPPLWEVVHYFDWIWTPDNFGRGGNIFCTCMHVTWFVNSISERGPRASNLPRTTNAFVSMQLGATRLFPLRWKQMELWPAVPWCYPLKWKKNKLFYFLARFFATSNLVWLFRLISPPHPSPALELEKKPSPSLCRFLIQNTCTEWIFQKVWMAKKPLVLVL